MNGASGWKLLSIGLLIGTAVVVGVGAQPAPPPKVVSLFKYVPAGPLSPYIIPDKLQDFAIRSVVPAKISADSYFDFYKESIPLLGNSSFYTDLLTGVDVVAKAWGSRHGVVEPSERDYAYTLCFLSNPLPGCRPKSSSNRGKMLRVRQQLLVGSYASEIKRESLQTRLIDRFYQLGNLEDMKLDVVDIEEYIQIKDLLQ